MPYNTRRKSLSLPSLGIHIPLTHAERTAAQAAARGTTTHTHVKPTAGGYATEDQTCESPTVHPSKRLKRSHTRSTSIPAHGISTAPESPSRCLYRLPENTTPPPSPGPVEAIRLSKVQQRTTDSIPSDDEFVDAVLEQLRSTGNKPQPTKELSAALARRFSYINQSANPCSVVASRLAAYMRQPAWSKSTPCPIGKLIAGNPRRTYYFVNATQKDAPQIDGVSRIRITSIVPHCRPASPPDSDEEIRLDRRRALSPSPEVDLGTSSLDDVNDDAPQPETPVGSAPSSVFISDAHQMGVALLERDEKEFTQTADGLQKRKMSGTDMLEIPRMMENDDWARDDPCWGSWRFAPSYSITTQIPPLSSPSMKPDLLKGMKRDSHWSRVDRVTEWDQSPENIELDELDVLFATS